ncbi:MAG: helix-turn-helix transcriptional regulator [Clostridiales bacterium]|jgi:putative transcriptional regulator|nr:helix-turn-helix transcriptional regulator [Clostridiales bacterium]
MKLNNRLRKLRFEQDEMTQQALADALGVSRMTVYSIEKGKYVPSTLLALKLAGVFGKPVEEIFYLGDAVSGNEEENEHD